MVSEINQKYKNIQFFEKEGEVKDNEPRRERERNEGNVSATSEKEAAKPAQSRYSGLKERAKTQLEKYRARATKYEAARQESAKNYQQSVKGFRARFGIHKTKAGRPSRAWQRSAQNRPQREIADARRFVGNPQNEYAGDDNFGILHDFMSARRSPEDSGLGVPNLLQEWSFGGREQEHERDNGGFGFGIRTDLIGGGSRRRKNGDLL